MYRQRRAIERIVAAEVMRLERRQALERGDAHYPPPAMASRRAGSPPRAASGRHGGRA